MTLHQNRFLYTIHELVVLFKAKLQEHFYNIENNNKRNYQKKWVPL